MPRFETRPYQGESDLALLLDFARVATAGRWPRGSTWHPGDVVWQLVGTTGFDPVPNIHLWLDEKGVAALGWFEPPLNLTFELRADVDEPEVTEDLLRWAEGRRREEARIAAGDLPIAYSMLGTETLAVEMRHSETGRIAVLERNGYSQHERGSIQYARSLEVPIPEQHLPPGMKLRHATDADIEERAELHRDAWSVWGASKFSAETYRRLRAAPVYQEELDVVLEGPDGRLLSYCICWEDPANGVGNFEPVGTRPAFTGQRLAQAVIYEGLRRLKARGMHTAFVGTATVNERALSVYPRCGFKQVDTSSYWVKTIG